MGSRQQNKQELDERARQGETVVPGGTGGKSVEAQQHLAEGLSSIHTHIIYSSSFSYMHMKKHHIHHKFTTYPSFSSPFVYHLFQIHSA